MHFIILWARQEMKLLFKSDLIYHKDEWISWLIYPEPWFLLGKIELIVLKVINEIKLAIDDLNFLTSRMSFEASIARSPSHLFLFWCTPFEGVFWKTSFLL